MTLTRKLIFAFWVFIIIMLGWQLYSCNQGITQDAVEHPQQEHFFHYQSNAASGVQPAKPVYHGATLVQIAYTVQRDTPTNGQFTSVITIKNVGMAKATNIEVNVRPYRGIMSVDEDVARTMPTPIPDSDPLAQISQWVTFPDLGPGESSTQTAVFVSRSGIRTGTNPKPEINFDAEKKPQDLAPHQPATGG